MTNPLSKILIYVTLYLTLGGFLLYSGISLLVNGLSLNFFIVTSFFGLFYYLCWNAYKGLNTRVRPFSIFLLLVFFTAGFFVLDIFLGSGFSDRGWFTRHYVFKRLDSFYLIFGPLITYSILAINAVLESRNVTNYVRTVALLFVAFILPVSVFGTSAVLDYMDDREQETIREHSRENVEVTGFNDYLITTTEGNPIGFGVEYQIMHNASSTYNQLFLGGYRVSSIVPEPERRYSSDPESASFYYWFKPGVVYTVKLIRLPLEVNLKLNPSSEEIDLGIACMDVYEVPAQFIQKELQDPNTLYEYNSYFYNIYFPELPLSRVYQEKDFYTTLLSEGIESCNKGF